MSKEGKGKKEKDEGMSEDLKKFVKSNKRDPPKTDMNFKQTLEYWMDYLRERKLLETVPLGGPTLLGVLKEVLGNYNQYIKQIT